MLRESDVRAELTKLESHVSELPSDAVLRQVEGSRTSVAGKFTGLLSEVAEATAAATQSVAQEVLDSDSAVRAALNDLLGLDDEVAAGADQVDTSSTSTPASASPPGTSSGYGAYGGPAYHNRV